MTKVQWLGCFVTLILCAVGFSAPTKDKPTVAVGNNYQFLLTRAEGLKAGDSVKIGGVTNGYIERIDFAREEIQNYFSLLLPKGQVAVLATVNLALGTKVPIDSQYNISSDRSSTWLELYPGHLEYYAKSSDILYSSKRAEINDIRASLKNLSKSVGMLRAFLLPYLSPESKNNLKSLIAQVRKVSSQGVEWTEDIPEDIVSINEQVLTMEKTVDELQKAVSQKLNDYESIVLETQMAAVSNLSGQEQMIKVQGDQAIKSVTTVARVIHEYSTLLEKVASRWSHEENSKEFIEILHRWAKKLEDQAEIVENLHYVSKNKETQQSLKDMVHQLKIKAKKLRVKALQIELLFKRN